MAFNVIREVSFDTLGDVQVVQAEGLITNAQDGNKVVLQSIKGSGDTSTWDTTGVYDNQPVIVQFGFEITWDYKTASDTNKSFMMLLRNSPGIPFTNQSGFFHTSNNFRVWNGNTLNPEVEVLLSELNTWYNCKAIIGNDGTVDYFIKKETDQLFTFIGRTEVERTFDYRNQPIRFATNHFTNNSTHSVDNLVYGIDSRYATLNSYQFSLKESYG